VGEAIEADLLELHSARGVCLFLVRLIRLENSAPPLPVTEFDIMPIPSFIQTPVSPARTDTSRPQAEKFFADDRPPNLPPGIPPQVVPDTRERSSRTTGDCLLCVNRHYKNLLQHINYLHQDHLFTSEELIRFDSLSVIANM